MTDIQRYGQAHWSGDLRTGSGKISSASGGLRDLPYSVPSRFEEDIKPGLEAITLDVRLKRGV